MTPTDEQIEPERDEIERMCLGLDPRVWWKTGDEGEFLMSPAMRGDAEMTLADGWTPAYDRPRTEPDGIARTAGSRIGEQA